VPDRLTEVIERGVARDPQYRFATAWEWRDALRDAMDDEAPYDLYLPPAGPSPPNGLPDLAPLPSISMNPTTRLPPKSPTDVLGARGPGEAGAGSAVPAAGPVARVGRRLGPLDCSMLALLAAMLLLASPFFVWLRTLGPGSAIGLDYQGARVVMGCAVAIGIGVSLRLAFRGRWAIGILRILASLGGLVALGAGVVQGWWIHHDLGGLAAGDATFGIGLYLIGAGGAVALIGALRAGSQYRRSRPSPLGGLNGHAQPGHGSLPAQ
jgi:hypothetical protein